MTRTQGPLAGIRVLELASIGPGPHAAMLLADLGADVVRADRPASARSSLEDDASAGQWLLRGRRSIALDLKAPADLATALDLAARADVLIEGYRPGVAERLGIGPDECLARNPRLVYGRMTGWGQEGPRAQQAGHDINYLALTGGLFTTGRAGERPVPPLNMVADVAGGSMMLALGVVSALVERATTGRGQVVDAAMVDGTPAAMQMIWSLRGQGRWSDARGGNLLDGSNPSYDTYECAGGGYVAVGALEPQFYAQLLAGLGLEADRIPDRADPQQWPALREVFAARFAQRSRDEWARVFEGTDACVTPVLTLAEARAEPHMAHRGSIVVRDGVEQGAPAPRFSAHPDPRPTPAPPRPDADRATVLAEWLGE